MTFTKSTIQIGNYIADVFMDTTGKVYYSQTSVSSLIDRTQRSTIQFLASKWLKGVLPEVPTLSKFRVGGTSYALMSCELASLYITYWCSKGHAPAVTVSIALTQESLELRAKSAFSPVTHEVYQGVKTGIDTALDNWERARKATASTHVHFQNACLAKHHSARQVHDKLTKAICGYTASEHRLLELVKPESDKLIGLNHQVSPEMLLQVAEAKRLYTTYKKGNWKEQVARAVFHACPD
jgi:hypothetical protein